MLKAPFPWFGGKSRVAHIVWDHFGDVRNYVEPFAGSLAVLLGRPTEAKIETVNDLDCWIANFWRALRQDPEQVAIHADWPVNEADLHARHLWLVKQLDFRERMKTDPDFYDAKIAGWWAWGISQWIGSGWCATAGGTGRQDPPGDPWRKKPNVGDGGRGVLITPGRGAGGKSKPRGIHTEVSQKRPHISNHGGGMGVHRNVTAAIRPALNETSGIHAKRPRLARGGRGVSRQIPDLGGDSGAAGRAIHASGLEEKGGLYQWFFELAERLRRVRVCCGDWSRIVGPAPTTCIGTTAVFLDPPYAVEDRSDVYGEESRDVAHVVREWAIANGDNPELRIALCGYQGEHVMPESWSVVEWKANGGFANQKRSGTQGQQNATRERIWFSPHCLRPQENLFYQFQEISA